MFNSSLETVFQRLFLHPSVFLTSIWTCVQLSSVQFSHSVTSDSLRPHEPQHTRPPCPSPTPGVHPNPCPLSRWCYPTISSFVVPFSSCPQSFPASGSFQMRTCVQPCPSLGSDLHLVSVSFYCFSLFGFLLLSLLDSWHLYSRCINGLKNIKVERICEWDQSTCKVWENSPQIPCF